MLYYNTVNQSLKDILQLLMVSPYFDSFRLVGGTALSLQVGHRMSVDIDLFSDAAYGSIDFNAIDNYMETHFPYIDHSSTDIPGIGKSYYAGNQQENSIKIDVFYTDTFIQSPIIEDGIRLASVGEIIAMKVDVIQRGGRKKDFWDLHELLPKYGIREMLSLHQKRYEFAHDEIHILRKFTDFTLANDDFTPLCLRGKHWEFIKEDIEYAVSEYLNGI